MAAICHSRRSRKLKVQPKSWLSQKHRYNYFLHFSFCFILIILRLTELWPFKCQGHPVSMWHWPFICDLEKYRKVWKSIERPSRYSHLLTRHYPCNLQAKPTSLKHEYRGQIWGHPVTSSPWNILFLALFGTIFHIWSHNEPVFTISKFSI